MKNLVRKKKNSDSSESESEDDETNKKIARSITKRFQRRTNKDSRKNITTSATTLYYRYTDNKDNDDSESEDSESDDEDSNGKTINIKQTNNITNRNALNTLINKKTIKELENFFKKNSSKGAYDSDNSDSDNSESEDEDSGKTKKMGKNALDKKMNIGDHPYMLGFDHLLTSANADLSSYIISNPNIKMALAKMIVTNDKIKEFFKNHNAHDLIKLFVAIAASENEKRKQKKKKAAKKGKGDDVEKFGEECWGIAESFFTSSSLKVLKAVTADLRSDGIKFSSLIIDVITADHVNVYIKAYQIYRYIFKPKNITELCEIADISSERKRIKKFNKASDATKKFIEITVPEFLLCAGKYTAPGKQMFGDAIRRMKALTPQNINSFA